MEVETCNACNGVGKIEEARDYGATVDVRCNACNGRGHLDPDRPPAEGELMEAVDAGALELRRVAQVVVWDATGACPLRCKDCLRTHGPGPVVMVFDQQGGQVVEFTGNWIDLRGAILSAVFQHKGEHTVELHLGVPYQDGAMVEFPPTERRALVLPRGIDEVGL